MKNYLSGLLLILLFISTGVNSNTLTTDNVKARLISQVSIAEQGSVFAIALVFDIRDGWHTYWRNPGDSGQAPSIDWVLEDGVTVSGIEWPYPERQFMGPVANYGYHGTAYHLMHVQVPQDWPVGTPIQLIANAKWLVCEEECIPEKGQLTLSIETGVVAKRDETQTKIFSNIQTTLAQPLSALSAYQYSGEGDVRFDFERSEELSSVIDVEYFPYEWGVLQAPAEQKLIIDPEFISLSSKKGDLTFSGALNGVLVVEYVDGTKRAFEVESQYGALNVGSKGIEINQLDSSLSNAYSVPQISVLSALLFAFLGGIILNLMPCVFPVLSMKALSLVTHGHNGALYNRVEMRRQGLVYTLGILLSFTLLGTILVLVKAAGQQIGWGFQLQSPLFVSVVIVVLFVLSLSLSGYLELGASMMGAGSNLANKQGYAGSFFTGVLAVVVATPCTAPFMGPAIGFALTQTFVVTIAVLLALGLGLAFPFLLLSFFPLLTQYLPKPGAWMKTFQQFLAFPMLITTTWLVWVLGLQAGVNAIFSMLLALVLITFAIWSWQTSSARFRAVGRSISVFALCASALLIYWHSLQAKASDPVSLTQSSRSHYQPFSRDTLDVLLSNGDPVFVNMTAAWCITCLANEKVALSTDALNTYFNDNNITYLKGDWTNQDSEITQYLQSFGRNSVPLYVYYPSARDKGVVANATRDTTEDKTKEPIVLPQILTVDLVIKALSAAESTPSD